MQRIFKCLLIWMGALAIAGCDSNDVPTSSDDYKVVVVHVETLEEPIWQLTSADFNLDGQVDVLVHGHRGAELSQIYYGDGIGLTVSPFRFPAGADRHHCAAGDVDGDSLPDLYCTSGASQGTGANPNELWLNLDGYRFEKSIVNFGAEDPYSRGRLAVFFRFDEDATPDLATTVWGERTDQLRNESSVYLNDAGKFRRLDTLFSDRWGGRCLRAYDVNDDGLDDLIACAEERGAALFLNDGHRNFIRTELADSSKWWWDINIAAGTHDVSPMLALIGANSTKQFIQVQELTARLEYRDITRFRCDFFNPSNEEQIFCSAIAMTDLDKDGHVDLYISRRIGWLLEPPTGDTEDLIVFGPDFDLFVPVPFGGEGAGYVAAVSENGVLRSTAGEKWGGRLDLVSLKPGARTSASSRRTVQSPARSAGNARQQWRRGRSAPAGGGGRREWRK